MSIVPASEQAQEEAVGLCAELIRFDTSNPTSDERAAADWVVARLAEAGIESVLVESAPGRANVIARIAGADPSRGALLVHGHLDVVPADASEWQVPPFSGEIRDGYLWGRGAIDMKDTVAVMLATARHFARTGTRPARDLVLAFLADEEAGGKFGAHWLVEHRPELFAGATEAIGEGAGSPSRSTTPGGCTPSRTPSAAWPGWSSPPPAGRPRLVPQRRERGHRSRRVPHPHRP